MIPLAPSGIFLSPILACGALAQAPAGMHSHPKSVMIDGAAHPELIPDSTAYRLYFLVLSDATDPSGAPSPRQLAILRKAGCAEADGQRLVSALTAFRAEYTRMVAEYNRAANEAAARNERSDIAPLLDQREALVASTRSILSTSLSPDGRGKLDAYVQAEKKHMKVGPEGVAK